MSDISIIIAHRDVNTFSCRKCKTDVLNQAASAPLGLWATIHSCMEDLQNSGLSYEFCIYTNGAKSPHLDTQNVLHWLELAGKLKWVKNNESPVSPPLARQECTANASGKYLFFFDNHVLVKPGYFTRAIKSMEEYNMDMLHSVTRFFFGEKDCYHYNLRLDKNFWGESSFEPKETVPYRIAAGGHGGFIVRRSVWEEVGGYDWPNFKGYGGEEMYFDLKMALLGKTNWLDPELLHYHYAGNRGYYRHYTDEFFVNMMAVANIIGGSDWMYKVQESFTKNYSKLSTGKSIFELMIEAERLSKDQAAHLAVKRLMTLDELLESFKANNIAH